MSAVPNIVVIGAGIGGLTAAAYLARSGCKVTVFETRNVPGGLSATEMLGGDFSVPAGAHALHALDPQLVKDLKLARRGLRFAVRDMALVGLRPDGRHVVLSRDVHATARALAIHSKQDAQNWISARRSFEALARAMRAEWWGGPARELSEANRARLDMIGRMGAAAWLDSQFESDPLKTTLGFDALEGGLSPLEPGSALTLLWRAAQEMCGLQGAVAVPKGGPGALAAALAEAARLAGAEIRTGARVAAVLCEAGGVEGVELASGEHVVASHVLSSLSRRRTLCELLPPAEAGFGAASACVQARPRLAAAKVIFALDKMPVFGGVATPPTARFILADRMESYVAAHAAARAGRLPHDLAIEFTLPTAADPALAPMGQHLLSAMIRPVPAEPAEGWASLKPQLLERVRSALAAQVPDLARHVTQAEVLTPDDYRRQYGHEDDSSSLMHILDDWRTRIETPVRGLMLCGAAAEPVAAISGRAGRIAAHRIVTEVTR